ncbi:MAG TPA: hypothetical protein VM451_10160 [Candidatus Limnocylindria bacterium]|nr:hypothetical protein [Candidatus Limnocylindria bacterium]
MNRAPVARLAAVAPQRVALAASLALFVAACSVISPSATGTPGPGSSAVTSSSGISTLQPPSSFGPPTATEPGDTDPLILDSALLAYLPEAVDGIPVEEAPDEAALALTDPALPRIATALDVGVVVDIGNGNLATATVVRLKPEAFTVDVYRQWRESFDEGACAGSGGVVGRAEADIAGRPSYVTSCVNGLRTYHVLLEDEDVLISASAIGEGRFGEKLLTGVRIPE